MKNVSIQMMLAFGLILGAAASESEEGFKTIFNGENRDGWYLKIRSGDEELAKKVYAIEDGVIHIFNDEFPDAYNQNTGSNDTHGLFYTERTYTNYVLRFGYKWGTGYDWFATEDGTYLHPDDGGKPYDEGWLHLASKTDHHHHALDGQWNECEIIVMGDQYAIHKLNGDVINMAFNLKPAAGIFDFQSETAEIYYRNIRIKEYEAPVPPEQFLN
ncbi:DUF1080 domain-containing protein [Pontiellaceae bacterium B1224]|nr:DUF1080 domain-containing protein [Pontiellaceae bacterium B1224]